MSTKPQLFLVDTSNKKSEAMKEVNFSDLGLWERRDIQEWIAENPNILGEELLIITKEFSGFDKTGDRLDLLGVDKHGRLVVIELKRDDSGSDAHWQAIKYVSYLSDIKEDVICDMLASYKEATSVEDAQSALKGYLGTDDLDGLNNGQRIILASHRFAPEVTSAVLWLNKNSIEKDLITCIQLTPYKDENSDQLYVQVNTIIPVPGTEPYKVTVSTFTKEEGGLSHPTFAIRMKETKDSHRTDYITAFLRGVANLAIDELPLAIRPDMKSKWAGDGGGPHSGRRHYHLWYKDPQPPWGNWKMSYFINLYDKSEDVQEQLRAEIGLLYYDSGIQYMGSKLEGLAVFEDQAIGGSEIRVNRYGNDTDDAHFKNTLADALRHFIEVITPRIPDLQEQGNEEDA